VLPVTFQASKQGAAELDTGSAIPEDADEFMRGSRRLFMVTLRKDGSPTCHPMAAFYGGSLYLNMYRASAKAKNLGRDDRICCVLTTPFDAERFQGAVYKGHARELSVDEVFADQVSEGLAWARNPRSGGSQEQPDIPPEEERKIGETAGRIKRGKRMIFEISPDEVAMIQDVRGV
jgi:nitroimidazol reductase NimA-like FMN-containing flavoprotein (pyridoxamine 5'-phosphate oxidase superfamily)